MVFVLGTGWGVGFGDSLAVAADEADDGVVVGVDDKGAAVECLPA